MCAVQAQGHKRQKGRQQTDFVSTSIAELIEQPQDMRRQLKTSSQRLKATIQDVGLEQQKVDGGLRGLFNTLMRLDKSVLGGARASQEGSGIRRRDCRIKCHLDSCSLCALS